MEQIQTFKISKLLIAPHYEFHKLTVEAITKTTPQALHIADIFPAYKANVDKEARLLNSIYRLPHTDEIRRADENRDATLRYMYRMAKILKEHPERKLADAGETIWNVLGPNEGLWDYELTKETAYVRTIIQDFAPHEMKMLLDDYISQRVYGLLNQFNDDVEKLMQKRMDEISAQDKVDLEALRLETNEEYRDVRLRVNAYGMSDTTSVIDRFIRQHNGQIIQYRHVLAGMKRGGSGNEHIGKKE